MTKERALPIITILFFFTLYLAPSSLRAAERTSDHCIVGLFSRDRVDDLHKAMAEVPEVQLVHLDYETARATFRYDVKALFPSLDPRKQPTGAEIEHRMSQMLADASHDSFGLKPLSRISREKQTKVEIRIGILDCKGCRYAAYLVVTKEEGVEQAIVDTALVTAWIDPAKTSQAAIEAALKKANVEVFERK